MATRLQHRHERGKYYTQKVQETLTSRFCRVFCSIFLSILLIAALILFILWLSLRPHRPRVHVLAFNVTPGPSQENGYQSADVSFDVALRNPNHNIGIFYDDAMRGSLFYEDIQLGATAQLLSPFYQPPKNTTMLHGDFTGTALAAVDADMWKRISRDAAQDGAVWFRLELVVMIRFRVSTWDTHRHMMHADCVVGVSADGSTLAAAMNRRCSLYFG